jgi:hypothetical protein
VWFAQALPGLFFKDAAFCLPAAPIRLECTGVSAGTQNSDYALMQAITFWNSA